MVNSLLSVKSRARLLVVVGYITEISHNPILPLGIPVLADVNRAGQGNLKDSFLPHVDHCWASHKCSQSHALSNTEIENIWGMPQDPTPFSS